MKPLIHIWKHIYSKMIVAPHQYLGMMHRTKTDNDLPSKLCLWDLPSPGPSKGPAFYFPAL